MSSPSYSYFGSMVRPERFLPSELESRFLRQYRSVGLRWSRSASIIGIILIVSFWAIVAVKVPSVGLFEGRQVLRGLVALFLAGFLVFSILWPRFTLRHYSIVAGIPIFAVCSFVVVMAMLPPESDYHRSSRFAVAMILCSCMVYGFTRVPVLLAFSMCGLASLVVIIGLYLNGDEYFLAMSLYMIMANVVGWALSVSSERRERELFMMKRGLVSMARRMQRAARESRESNKEKGRILAAISHDLRQPVGSMATYLDCLECSGALSSSQMELLIRAKTCAQIVGDSVERISAASTSGNRDGGEILERVDLGAMLVRLQEAFLGVADRKSVRLIWDVGDHGASVGVSNYILLWDILSNLVSNAIKYSSGNPGDCVSVRLRARESFLSVLIVDNGIGIPKPCQSLVFERYFQVGVVQSRGGFGLGLAIVKDSIDKLPGHRVTLRSSVGKGTAFRVVVPTRCYAETELVQFTNGGQGVERGAEVAGVYVLVLCEDQARREVLCECLGRHGCLVENALGLDDAVRTCALLERNFDVLVIDISGHTLDWAAMVASAVESAQGSRVGCEVIVGGESLGVELLSDGRVFLGGSLNSEETQRAMIRHIEKRLLEVA